MKHEDARFSRAIRDRDGWVCQMCHRGFSEGSASLHCAHMFNRWKPTRMEMDNAAALCWECHPFLDQRPDMKRAFFRARLGDERFEELQLMSNGVTV